MATEERAIREKLRMSVKEKVEAKLNDIEVTDEFAKELAIELIYEMEDLVQDKLAAFRDTLDEDIGEVYENQHFYWVGEDCNEMMIRSSQPTTALAYFFSLYK